MKETNALKIAIEKYFETHDLGKIRANITSIEDDVLDLAYEQFNAHNLICPSGERWRKPKKLTPFMIAIILSHLYTIKRIKFDIGSVLAIYQDEGKNAGTYALDALDPDYLNRIIRYISPDTSIKDLAEIRSYLSSSVETAEETREQDLIAVANGVFNYKTKQLMPFDKKYIFTTKLATEYKPAPSMNPTIHNNDDNTDWDIENWMRSLSDDPKVVDLLWSVIGAVIRPNVRWDKAVFLTGSSGANGKGTFCQLLRNLCGDDYHISLSLSELSERFLPASLTTVKAIITDENDVGNYITAGSKFKAMVTGDPLSLEAKFKDKVSVRFRGVMIQCLNDESKFKDKTESLYRRFLMIPFKKRFLGMERKYIKTDYLNRKEVLEYVLWRVLNTNYYELPEPDVCKIEFEKFTEINDPLRIFLAEMLPLLRWDTVPFSFLYDLYCKWFNRNNPSGSKISSIIFKNAVAENINNNRDVSWYAAWESIEYDDKGHFKTLRVSKQDKMTPEPLISEYEMREWMNEYCRTNDLNKLCLPSGNKRKDTCHGIRRIVCSSPQPVSRNPQ